MEALSIARQLRLETHGFADILRAETSGVSSMSPSSHEVVPIYAQISSLHSLLGFWWQSSVAQSVLAAALVVALGAVVAWRVYTARTEYESVPAIGAWLAFGLLATYHRAHDALVLLVLLPWLIETIRRTPRLWYPWAILLLYGAFNLSAAFDLVRLRIADGQYNSFLSFLLLRQAALANLGLLLVLLASTAGAKRYFRSTHEASPTRQALVTS
jgi:drug/metabolite transporter (DMT)-like permease